MEELKVGERVILQAIEQDVCNGCDDCFFGYDDICCNPT
nr:MAG TPA: Alcohol dehydrogenase GroES-like domain [Caudoviricetes sp.]